MHIASDSMQGINMNATQSTITPSTVPAKTDLLTTLDHNFQKPGVAFTIVTFVVLLIMVGGYWLLKRITSWEFPVNKKGIN